MNTIEGALALSVIILTTGTLVGGLVTLAQHSAATSLARDAARAESLGSAGAAVVSQRDPGAQVQISRERSGELTLVQVQVTKQAALFDVTGRAWVLVEPREDGQGGQSAQSEQGEGSQAGVRP